MANLKHLTYSELLNIVVGFDNYVNGLISDYSTDGLNEYYTKQNYSDKPDGESNLIIEDKIISWVYNDNDSNPIAILASYGMGKTTLAKRIAYILSKYHISNPSNRIPILIKLEEFVTEQSLEGLLGKHFTSFSNVPNYNFRIFNKLNSIGRFVIILDGFDEMKSSISYEALRYNFNQLNRLINPNSKIIILGRPTVFLTENEQRELLHGERNIGNKISKIPDSPNFTEYNLLPFNKEQITEFISKYYRFYNKKSIGQINLKIDPQNKFLTSIMQRPVQLKMLIELLPSYTGELDNLSTTVLYSEFIDLVIRREQDKQSRSSYNVEQRRGFATNLAYWMWTENLGYGVRVDEIPDNLFLESVDNKENRNFTDIKRDLLNACFLERKEPLGFFFPHRSFQEFLIAEKLYSMVEKKNPEIYKIEYMSPEILEFFCALFTDREAKNWKDRIILQGDLVEYTKSFIKFFVDVCNYYNLKITKQEINFLTRRSPDWILLPESRKNPKKPHRLEGVTPKKKYKKD